jgi:hypothetical protein
MHITWKFSILCMPFYTMSEYNSMFLTAAAGQNEAAERLHSNFTAAWATWGWLPEVFGADLSAVHPEDPGYNLRPEHIESTWYLKAVSGDPTGYYTGVAAAMMAVLNHSRVECGYAPIRDVNTGARSRLLAGSSLAVAVLAVAPDVVVLTMCKHACLLQLLPRALECCRALAWMSAVPAVAHVRVLTTHLLLLLPTRCPH